MPARALSLCFACLIIIISGAPRTLQGTELTRHPDDLAIVLAVGPYCHTDDRVCMCVCVRAIVRERGREGDRQTDRQTGRQTDRQGKRGIKGARRSRYACEKSFIVPKEPEHAKRALSYQKNPIMP